MALQAQVMLAKELPSLRCHFLWLVERLGLRDSQAMAAVAAVVVLFTTLLTGLLQALLGLMAVGQMQGLGAKRQPHILAATVARLVVMGPALEAELQPGWANLRLQEMVAVAGLLAHIKAAVAAAVQIDRAVAAAVRLTLTRRFWQIVATLE